MKTHAVASAEQRARYATWRKMMSEPTLEDSTARGLDDEPFLSSCYYCDADIYIHDERFRYCEQCIAEGK